MARPSRYFMGKHLERYTALLVIAAIVLAAACNKPRSSTSVLPSGAERIGDIAAELRVAFDRENDQLLFRSWNGEWRGTDSDIEFALKEDGTVTLTEFGVGSFQYSGTYRISRVDGLEQMQLEVGAGNPKPMWLFRDEADLLFVPSEFPPDLTGVESQRLLFRLVTGRPSRGEG